MSEVTQVGAPYLRKVLNRLREAGIVATQRGSGGGVNLVREPDELTILDVVNAVEPLGRLQRCPLGLPAHMELCPLHSELDKAISLIEETLSRRTIAELLASGAHANSGERCPFPQPTQTLYQL